MGLSMVDKVILHIGMHKTGSTSIQEALKDYDDGKTFYAPFQEANHSAAIRSAFSKRPEDFHSWRKLGLDRSEVLSRRNQYRSQLVSDLKRKDRDQLIISGEDIGLLEEAGKHELVELLNRHAKIIQVVCYIRAPMEFAASYLQQQIKTGRKSLPELIKTDYKKRLTFFKEHLPTDQIIVKSFNRQTLQRGCVVSDFCRTCGIDSTQVPKSRLNESLSAPALKLLYSFNRSNGCYQGDLVTHRAHHLLIQWIAHDYRTGPGIKQSRFLPMSDFSELDYLRDKFGLHFEPPNPQIHSGDQSLEAWLTDTSDIDMEPLNQRLAQIGVNSQNKSVDFLLNRLYYHALVVTALRHQQVRIQPNMISRGLLRDVIKSLFIATFNTIRRRIFTPAHRRADRNG
ncbi:hypothetical protein [Wenzhouxiangella limi]|uniref:Sulfotransferase family protein n=1 Tax=Wenzhouxiangella limi TaxID=2707351 RepID=A0A845V119_9GAMM|nr:hypothetical protein [Wenzhouxiangella limi]NDY96292.1 hypothetical protein [Wenzhouxiangella limi]